MVPGELVLISHPFTDLSATKVRPCLVISSEAYNKQQEDVIFIPISSSKNFNPLVPEDILIDETDSDFSTTGLKHSSVIRVGKIFTLNKKLAKRYLGKISDSFLYKVRNKLKKLLGI